MLNLKFLSARCTDTHGASIQTCGKPTVLLWAAEAEDFGRCTTSGRGASAKVSVFSCLKCGQDVISAIWQMSVMYLLDKEPEPVEPQYPYPDRVGSTDSFLRFCGPCKGRPAGRPVGLVDLFAHVQLTFAKDSFALEVEGSPLTEHDLEGTTVF